MGPYHVATTSLASSNFSFCPDPAQEDDTPPNEWLRRCLLPYSRRNVVTAPFEARSGTERPTTRRRPDGCHPAGISLPVPAGLAALAMYPLALLVSALLGCSGSDAAKSPVPAPRRDTSVNSTVAAPPPKAPDAQPTLDLGTASGGIRWKALDALATGTYTLAPENRDAAGAKDGEFTLKPTWQQGASFGRMQTYNQPLPFECTMPRPNYAPMGARFMHDGVELPYLNGTVNEKTAAPTGVWYVDHGKIKLLSPEDPRTWKTPATIEVVEIATALARRNFNTAGVSAADFVQTTLVTTEDGAEVTRPGLLLPAPSTATFPVTIPEDGRLRFGVGILADPISGETAGDGAAVAVTINGENAWSGRADGAQAGSANVDLSGWAGQTVTLSLTTTPGDTNVGDYVVLTSPYIHGKGGRPPRRIVQIGIDTLRYDALSAHGYSKQTSRELDAWAEQSVIFDNAYAPAPRTRPSFRSSLTGRYPLAAIHAKGVAEVIAPLGIATGGVVANVHLVPRFRFNAGFDEWRYENGARAEIEVDRAIAFLKAHETEDTYLFVHLMDPHTFYNAPEPFKSQFVASARPPEVPEKFNRWQIIQLMKRRKLTDEGKTWIRSSYDAEVATAAHEAARLLGELDRLAGATLTILQSDHGEEFWDHRGYEHNHTLYNELVHAVLWIRPPGGWAGKHRVAEPVGLIDIMPTILDVLDVPAADRPVADGRSLRAFFDAGRASQLDAEKAVFTARPLMLGHLAFDKEKWAVVTMGKKYTLGTHSGNEEVFDLTVDPDEQNDLYKQTDAAALTTLRAAMEQASGWPVRHGWRVRLPVEVKPTTFTFAGPIEAAGIMDPQARLTTRTNFEWGEKADVMAEDVGVVSLSDDHRVVTFTPGANSYGQALWFTCPTAECPAGKVEMDGKGAPFATRDNLMGGTRYRIEPGILIIPRETEAEIVAESVGDSTIDALEKLGYLEAPGGD